MKQSKRGQYPREPAEPTEVLTIRLPVELAQRLRDRALKLKLPLNSYLKQLLMQALGLDP